MSDRKREKSALWFQTFRPRCTISSVSQMLHFFLCVLCFPVLPLSESWCDFIIQVLHTVGWWVFELVKGRTPEWRYLMGQKAALSWLWDLLVLAVAIDFSSKWSPCFLFGLRRNPCQAGQMCLFAWAQTGVNFHFCSDELYTCPWTNYPDWNSHRVYFCICFVSHCRNFVSLFLFSLFVVVGFLLYSSVSLCYYFVCVFW